MRHLLLAATAVAALLLAGCSGPTTDAYSGVLKDGVREIEVHIGWNDDRQTQYMQPSEIRVKQGDKVRLVVTNDDLPTEDFNGERSGRDNFHDVALLGYDGDGDGVKDDIEHEAPAGRTTVTSLKGKDHFVATTAGTFSIICEVKTSPSHADLGMKARFVVEA